MRKFIFKYELEYLFLNYKIPSGECEKIKEELFENSDPVDKTKQYHIKEDYFDITNIGGTLKKITRNEKFIGALKGLLTVNDDLNIPTELKEKIISNNVVVFIGAGVSKLLGYPLWNDLSDAAIEYLREKGIINHFEYEKIINEIKDPKQKLSIFDKFCSRKDKLGREFYLKVFKGGKQNENFVNPYKFIVSSYFNWIKLTSNIDNELKKAFQNAPVKNSSQFTNQESSSKAVIEREKEIKVISSNFDPTTLSPDELYYLHGELNNIPDTIFTTEDYIKNYFKEDSNLRKFLKDIFNKYTVLFIGYGLEEFPILEAIFQKEIIGEANKHFALTGTYLNEMNLFNIKKKYYNSLKISIIPYYLDFNGYFRLNQVLESWENEIKEEKKTSFLDNINSIDEVL